MTEDQKAKFKFSCKKKNGYSMNMDGTIRSAEHAAVVVAALDGQYPDNHDLINTATELLDAAKAALFVLRIVYQREPGTNEAGAIAALEAAIAKAGGRA